MRVLYTVYTAMNQYALVCVFVCLVRSYPCGNSLLAICSVHVANRGSVVAETARNRETFCGVFQLFLTYYRRCEATRQQFK